MDIQVKIAALDEVPKLYEKFIEPYFPANEKKPLKSILRMMESGCYRVLFLEADQVPSGAAFLVTHPSGGIYLLDYLAVDDKKRNCGLGGRLLRAVSETVGGNPVLIETEAIDAASTPEERNARERRCRFYANNGARKTGVTTDIFEAIYDNWMLTADSDTPLFSKEETMEKLTSIYRFMVPGEAMFKANVFIPYEP